MAYLTPEPKILGMYFSDSGNVYNNNRTNLFVANEMNGYVPVLDLIEITKNEDLRLVDGKNVDNELVTYNKLTSSRKLDDKAIRHKKLDVTANDLYVGPVRLFLNFSNYHVSLNSRGEFRKTYSPLESSKMENFKGKMFIVDLHTFNTPQFIRDVAGVSNYFETLMAKFKMTTNKSLTEVKAMLQYMNDHWLSANYFEVKETTSTIKIATMVEIDEAELVKDNKKEVYLLNRDLLVSLQNIVEMGEHPDTMNVLIHQRETQNYLKNNSFVCYIVDNENLISDRYINIAGSVRKIQKTKNSSMVNGLYIITTDSDGKPHSEIICSLDKLDENQYVYKTVEEANVGADIKNRYKDELEQSRNELELEKINRHNESLELKARYEALVRDLTVKHEEKMNQLRREMDSFKAEKEKAAIETKSRYDDFKYDIDARHLYTKFRYEEGKFERDTTIETLKTLGAVAGLVAGGMVLYGKMTK